jgi:hypothetical protein
MYTCEIIYADYAAGSDSISPAHAGERLSEVAGLTPAQQFTTFAAITDFFMCLRMHTCKYI